MNRYTLIGLGGKSFAETWANSFDGARRSFVKRYRGRYYIVRKVNFDFVSTYL